MRCTVNELGVSESVINPVAKPANAASPGRNWTAASNTATTMKSRLIRPATSGRTV